MGVSARDFRSFWRETTLIGRLETGRWTSKAQLFCDSAAEISSRDWLAGAEGFELSDVNWNLPRSQAAIGSKWEVFFLPRIAKWLFVFNSKFLRMDEAHRS
jgi:hypothetical protein